MSAVGLLPDSVVKGGLELVLNMSHLGLSRR
jgi:hypothetical protein